MRQYAAPLLEIPPIVPSLIGKLAGAASRDQFDELRVVATDLDLEIDTKLLRREGDAYVLYGMPGVLTRHYLPHLFVEKPVALWVSSRLWTKVLLNGRLVTWFDAESIAGFHAFCAGQLEGVARA